MRDWGLVVRVRLLGPLGVLDGGRAQPVAGLRRKAVLAALALHPGQVVAVDRLVEIVWGDRPPEHAAVTLQSHVSHLRRVLADANLVLSRPPGYQLNVAEPVTDVQVVERLLREATQVGDPIEAAGRLREAIGWWQGRPLADLVELPWFAGQAQRLERLLEHIRHALVEARLALGEHVELTTELQHLAGQQPLDEPIHGQLMLALYRAGRQADALAVYQRLYRQLDDELGVAPGPPLRDLHTAILRQDASLDAPAVASRSTVTAAPAQLPPAIVGFAGRADALAQLDALLAAMPATVPVALLSGCAGVGKTTLAVHWAHRVAGRFPDGQVFLNLRGFDAGQQPRDPADALRRLLDALGVAEHLPDDTDALSTLFRSTMAGRRMLVILDNARTAAQVRPLLPGTPGCLVLVTSRARLTGLLAGEGAVPIALDLPSAEEAHQLLAGRLGRDRLAAEPSAVPSIIARCARLPLALAIVAARAATRPSQPLAELAAELRDSDSGLDAFADAGDPDTDVRAVFSWSYQTLSGPGARLFRLIGLHPGPELSTAAAASLAGLSPARLRSLLAELAGANLITEARFGRYVQHELLRAYAMDLAGAVDSAEERAAANLRLLDHLLHTAVAAARLLQPVRKGLALDPATAGVTVETVADRERAEDWFVAECAVLLAAVDNAFTLGYDGHAARLGSVIGDFLARRGRWHDQLPVQHTALAAAERADDPELQVRLRNQLGCTYTMLGRFDRAGFHLVEALDLSLRLGDPAAEASTHRTFAMLAEAQAQHAKALHHASRALELWETCADPRREALALSMMAWSHEMLGDHEAAVAHCERALTLLRQWDQPAVESAVLDSLGYALHHLGRCDQAVPNFLKAIELNRRLGNPYSEAHCHLHLGDCHAAGGDTDAARARWEHALALLDQLGHRDAMQVRTRLAETVSPHRLNGTRLDRSFAPSR